MNAAWLDRLRAKLKAAKADGRPVAVGAARHSMGGQALPRQGVALNFDVGDEFRTSGALAANASTYRIVAGARWHEVVTALDPLGYSPTVMQANNDFGVGATLSVNAHGWPVPHGPIGGTVRSLRLMLASGEVVTCSTVENADLLALAIGGYGLVGVVIDAELTMIPNEMLMPHFVHLAAAEAGPSFVAAIQRDADVRMAYGRLAVDRRAFLREAMIVTFRTSPGSPHMTHPGTIFTALSRDIFRAQIGSDNAKRARWYAETVIGPKMLTNPVSRNTLLSEPVAIFAGHDRKRTDILHEYFLPAEALEAFLAECRRAIPASRQELINVTLRYVEEDRMSVLAYAHGQRVAAVMLFSQQMTNAADDDMRALTERLIDAALDAGGSFYLPYRLHARPDQIARAYPRIEEFLHGKRTHDPDRLFRNLMWDRYFAADRDGTRN